MSNDILSLLLSPVDDVTPVLRCPSATASLSDLSDGVRSAACHPKECGSTGWWSIRSSAPLRSRCTMSTLATWPWCRAPTSSSSSRGISNIWAAISLLLLSWSVSVFCCALYSSSLCFSGHVIRFFQHKLFRHHSLELNPPLWVW